MDKIELILRIALFVLELIIKLKK